MYATSVLIPTLACLLMRGGICVLTDYDEQPVKIRLIDENDEMPQFVNVPRPFLAMVSANAAPGTSVYQLMAQDADEGSLVRYNLESGEHLTKRFMFFMDVLP